MKTKISLLLLTLFQSLMVAGQFQFGERYHGSFSTISFALNEDTIWLGTSNGLLKISKSEDKILHVYNRFNSSLDSFINAISINVSNTISVVTGYSRISLLEDDEWKSWSAIEIAGIQEKQPRFEHLVLADDGSIYCYDARNAKIFRYTNSQWSELFDLDQLNTSFYKFLKHPDGTVYWLNGGTFFHEPTSMMRMDSSKTISLVPNMLDVAVGRDGLIYGLLESGYLVTIKSNGTIQIKAKIPWAFNFEECWMTVADDSSIYIISRTKLGRYKDKKFDEFVNTKLDDYPTGAIDVDQTGVVWILYGNDYMLCKFHDEQFNLFRIGLGQQNSITANSDKSVLWFETNGFICSYDVKKKSIQYHDLGKTVYPRQFAEADRAEEMWLATSDGLYRFDGQYWQHVYATNDLNKLKNYKPGKLIGTFSSVQYFRLKVFDIKTTSWTNFDNSLLFMRNPTFALDTNLRPWVNLSDSIGYYDNGKWNFISPNNSNIPKEKWIQFEFDSKSTLYIATAKRVYCYDGINWKLIADAPDNCPWTSTLYVDSRDWLWLGNNCLNYDYYDGQNWHDITDQQSGNPGSITGSLQEDLNGDIWAGSNPVVRYEYLPTKTNDVSKSKNHLMVYPNPASDKIMIESSEAIGSIHLLDIFGKEVSSLIVKNNKTLFDTGNIIPGIYTLIWITNSKRLSTKIMIIN